MRQLVRRTYRTYFNTALGEPERHTSRLTLFLFISLVFALFSSDTPPAVYSMMATGIAILTGFTFTALFSDHAVASSGLPEPKTEDDIQDLQRLKVLSENFSARSTYFITLSILEVVLLSAASFELKAPEFITLLDTEIEWVSSFFSHNFLEIIGTLPMIISFLFVFLLNFLYLECLYTFYRMAETMLAILEGRRGYLEAKR